ncbi:MAG: hypothetical protein AAF492_00530 [Verrucomicrobiota bacterium]
MSIPRKLYQICRISGYVFGILGAICYVAGDRFKPAAGVLLILMLSVFCLSYGLYSVISVQRNGRNG